LGEGTKGTFGVVGESFEGVEGDFWEVRNAKKAPRAKAIPAKAIAATAMALPFLFLTSILWDWFLSLAFISKFPKSC
jgi:hypothetical protein